MGMLSFCGCARVTEIFTLPAYFIAGPIIKAKSIYKSRKACRQTIDEYESNIDENLINFNIANCYAMFKEYDKAIEFYLEKSAHSSLGSVYYKSSRYEQSVKHYEQAVKECSGPNKYRCWELRMYLGKAYVKSRNIEAAEREIEYLKTQKDSKALNWANEIQEIIDDKTHIKR